MKTKSIEIVKCGECPLCDCAWDDTDIKPGDPPQEDCPLRKHAMFLYLKPEHPMLQPQLPLDAGTESCAHYCPDNGVCEKGHTATPDRCMQCDEHSGPPSAPLAATPLAKQKIACPRCHGTGEHYAVFQPWIIDEPGSAPKAPEPLDAAPCPACEGAKEVTVEKALALLSRWGQEYKALATQRNAKVIELGPSTLAALAGMLGGKGESQ